MGFYVYILRSRVDGSYYKGFTEDHVQRLVDHNAGRSQYTATKMPWQMIYVEELPTKWEALIREKKLKQCKAAYFEWLVLQPTKLVG